MAKKTAAPTPLPPALIKARQEGTRIVSPLEAEVQALTVSTPEEYEAADMLLGDIRRARSKWAEKMSPILDPLQDAIRAAKKAKEGADKLNKEVDGPLEHLYNQVRDKMADFKREEARQIAEAKRKQEQESEKINQQLEAVSASELTARTRQMRERLAARREQLVQQAEEVLDSSPQAIKGSNSQARTVRKWRITDMQLVLRMIADGALPAEILNVNYPYINRQMLSDPEVVKKWAGFELYEDVVIAGRG